ncbi:MAG: hypothetical protein ACKOHK_06595, partial [Planctomycetia bacterium]
MFPLPEPPLSPAAYQFLADLVYRRSRIRLGADKQALVAGRLGRRLQAVGCGSYEEYCELLEAAGGEDEISALVDLISTNHTHFFREPAHFDILSHRALPTGADRAAAAGRHERAEILHRLRQQLGLAVERGRRARALPGSGGIAAGHPVHLGQRQADLLDA